MAVKPKAATALTKVVDTVVAAVVPKGAAAEASLTMVIFLFFSYNILSINRHTLFQMDPAGTTKVMQAVVTPKGIMAMEVVDVSSLKPTTTFRTFFSQMFPRRIAGPGISRPTDRLYVHVLSHLSFI